jgi:hypothetical protein
VREAFAPLASTPQLQALVLGDEQEDDLEALAASGAISAAAYHRRIASAAALAAPGGAPYAATNVGVAPPPRGRGAYVRKR